ncbi:hypothetical protein QJS10_CPB18g00625 [Acorus calamus]|uniref:Fe-S metabolism associated domain-containing protein n=1 Tax=Acorus calamus TaxID=4465 RepID=A0AAV9CKP8_ACOCL|nr:hypothetical protein QJS10_CPB18g00625 [Acorus calamus]
MDSVAISTNIFLLHPNPNPNFPSRRTLRVRCTLRDPQINKPLSSDSPRLKLRRLVSEFESLPEPLDRVKLLLRRASSLPPLPDPDRVPANRVMGCTAQVWLSSSMDPLSGRMRFAADSDSEITRGFCACLVSVLDGASPEEVMAMKTGDLAALNIAGAMDSRVNAWHNVLVGMQKRTRAIVASGEGRPPVQRFPLLDVSADGIEAKGSYSEAQAKFLSPDESKVGELISILREKKIGIVAPFYMDPEVQGLLTALWLHIYISDLLVMADTDVKMAEAGCEHIAVLGVDFMSDFMSENVRSILDQDGFNEMNSLSSLLRVCRQLPDKDDSLSAYKAKRFNATTPHAVAELGCEPILHMRHSQASGKLPDKLVGQILGGKDNRIPTPR